MSSGFVRDALPVGSEGRTERAGRAAGGGGAAEARRGGLSTADHLTLLAIGVVVLLVSLPRLRRFALRENELDAIQSLRVLAGDAAARPEVVASGGLGALLATSERHASRLSDLEVLDDGRLRRHGYLLDAVESESGHWVLRAWPWEHGRTGLGAFVATAEGVRGTTTDQGRWSGPTHPPPARTSGGVGWLALRR